MNIRCPVRVLPLAFKFLMAFAWIVPGLFPTQAMGQTPTANGDSATKVTILAWNTEIGGSDLATIQEQLKQLEPFDIVCLSEVPRASANQFFSRWGENASFIGKKGGEACLLVSWNEQRFEKIGTQELEQFDGQELAPGIQAAPLIVQLRDKATKQDLTVVMNHLARGSAELRKRQALALVAWAKKQSSPVIAVGGYNFDYDFPTKKGNEAFQAFLADDTWKWIEPKELIDTNWSDRNRDGKDDYPDSMLDFVFTTGPAKNWKVACEVVVRPGDFPDNEKTSDQRPVRTLVELPSSPPPASSCDVIERRVISYDASHYHGWPTLARRKNGELMVVCSGGRETHVCPFGQLIWMRSKDNGVTWSWPQVLYDGPIDDRDAGVVETVKGSILVTNFTSLAYESILLKAEKAKPGEAGFFSDPKRLAAWQAVPQSNARKPTQSGIRNLHVSFY